MTSYINEQIYTTKISKEMDIKNTCKVNVIYLDKISQNFNRQIIRLILFVIAAVAQDGK